MKNAIKVTTTTTAKEIADVCTTTTAAKGYFKELIAAGMDRTTAKEITTAAAGIVKDRNKETAAENNIIRNEITTAKKWYRDGNKVFHAVFVSFVQSADFRMATKSFGFQGNESDFVQKYIPIRTAAGRPVKIVREYIDGVLFIRYRFIDTDRSGSFRTLLDRCLDSVKKERIGCFTQKVIPVRK